MLKVGDKIKIRAQHPEGGLTLDTHAEVVALHEKFCVLKRCGYRFCAFYGDLKSGKVIVA